jgi:hypothetical protein
MTKPDFSAPPFSARFAEAPPAAACAALADAMQRTGLLEDPAPAAALRWVETFVEAYGPHFATAGEALPAVRALRAEAVTIPALALERLRNRQVVFYLDAVSQYVDDQPELRGLSLQHDLLEIAAEFGLAPEEALWAVRVALTAEPEGPAFELLFPLLGHDRILMRVGAVSSHLLHGRGLEPIKYGPDGKPFATIQGVRPPG